MAEQQAGPETDTSEPPKKSSRAGRNLPAAIGVGVLLGAMAIGILLFAPIGWLPVLAVAIPIATHEVVRRLREAGYALPIIPLLLGGQAMIWLTVSTVRPAWWGRTARRSSCAWCGDWSGTVFASSR